ncbi:MAG: glucose-1-phosphate thymidylyltransferase [Bacteroidales bacterium]|jgi:UDP-N-acetylglucosamine diphosphorylase/glucosamine-1-phosphate N-acetyltransferase|nr:glucose-1-phosphate thymidylyltransferase [Bacteroidales bacterium]
MTVTLFDILPIRNNLLPLTYTKSIADIHIGISTIKEKWQKILNCDINVLTEDYLQGKYLQNFDKNATFLFINSSFLPDEHLVESLMQLKTNECIYYEDALLAAKIQLSKMFSFAQFQDEVVDIFNNDLKKYFVADGQKLLRITHLWDIFMLNDEVLQKEIAQMRKIFKPAIFEGNTIIGEGKNPLIVEEGAKIYASVLNLNEGGIYIRKDAEIMEGCCIRGNFALGAHSVVKMGAKIYGGTTIGDYCKVGGEISNVIFNGYSNKAHDGFLGNSVIGDWCNIGAGANASNLKNSYGEVDLWSFSEQKFLPTGLQFCGLFMGDYTRAGIQTMFNTGSVTGVAANVFGSGFQRRNIRSFRFGEKQGNFDQIVKVINKMMLRRNKMLSSVDLSILEYLYLKVKSEEE